MKVSRPPYNGCVHFQNTFYVTYVCEIFFLSYHAFELPGKNFYIYFSFLENVEKWN